MAANFPGTGMMVPGVLYACVMTRPKEVEYYETPTVLTPDSIEELHGELPEELPEGFVEGVEPEENMLLFIKKDVYVGEAKFPGMMYRYQGGKWLKCACKECGRPGNPPGSQCDSCSEGVEVKVRFGMDCVKWDLLTGIDFLANMDCTPVLISGKVKAAVQKGFDNELSSAEAYALHSEVRRLCWSMLNRKTDAGKSVDALLMFTSILSHICDWEEHRGKHEANGSPARSDGLDTDGPAPSQEEG